MRIRAIAKSRAIHIASRLSATSVTLSASRSFVSCSKCSGAISDDFSHDICGLSGTGSCSNGMIIFFGVILSRVNRSASKAGVFGIPTLVIRYEVTWSRSCLQRGWGRALRAGRFLRLAGRAAKRSGPAQPGEPFLSAQTPDVELHSLLMKVF